MSISTLVLMLVGLLTYGFASNGKLGEVGRIIFFCALLALLIHDGGLHLRLTS